jgi:DNA-binding CsgD family transcriptional regulator
MQSIQDLLAAEKAPRPGRPKVSEGQPMTPKQQAIWDLYQEKKTYTEIAQILGVGVPLVNKALGVCRKKLGIKSDARERKLLENTNPEKTGAILDALSDPLEKVQDLLEQAGLPRNAADATVKRLKARYFGAITELKVLKTNEIIELLGKKIHLGMQYLDDKVMAEASARDIMLGLAALLEKRQLLRGEPTQIISDHERKTLHESIPLLMAEAQRRGLVVDVQAKVVA